MEGNPKSTFVTMEDAKAKILANPKTLAISFHPSYATDKRFQKLPFRETFSLFCSFALAKDSEYTGLLGHQIKLLYEYGLQDYTTGSTRNPIWQSSDAIYKTDQVEGPSVLGYDNVVFPFAILSSGVLCGIVFVVCEKINTVFSTFR